MGSSWRFFGCAVGFAFGVVWMTVGLGSAIVCLLVAAVGYGAVFLAERAQVNRPLKWVPKHETQSVPAEEFGLGDESFEELPADATTPLTAEAKYGWPWPAGDQVAAAEPEQEHAPVTGERS